MKNWTWKEWTALALVVAVLVAEVVSVFVAPWAAVLGAGTAVFAYIAGRIAGKRAAQPEAQKPEPATSSEPNETAKALNEVLKNAAADGVAKKPKRTTKK